MRQFSSLVPLTELVSSRETGTGTWSGRAIPKEKVALSTAVWMLGACRELCLCLLTDPVSHVFVCVWERALNVPCWDVQREVQWEITAPLPTRVAE